MYEIKPILLKIKYIRLIRIKQQNIQMGERKERSSLLWNIVDPDDPYDIRKSMIARLPEHNQNLMSGSLQIVCLMQAAQIQRISHYLEEITVKYKETERKELDRHSYEIQVKELTEKLLNYKSQTQDNEKLKDFIKRLTIELEEYKERVRKYEASEQTNSVQASKYQELKNKYDDLLNQLQRCRQFQGQFRQIQQQLRAFRIRYDQLERDKIKEIAQQREKYELKIKQRILIETQELQNSLNVYKSQIREMESKILMYREQLDAKNYEISGLLTKISGWEQQKASLLAKLKLMEDERLAFSGKAKEIQEINNKLREKSKEIEEIIRHKQTLERSIKDVQRFSQEVQADRQREANKVRELQSTIKLRDEQIFELRQRIEGREQRNKFEFKIRQLESQIQTKDDEIYELQQRVENRSVIQQLENKINFLTSQLRLKEQEVSQVKRQLETRQQAVYHQLENKIHALNSQIRNKDEQIIYLKQKTSNQQILQEKTQLENKVALLSTQIERLTYLIDKKAQQNNQLYVKMSKQEQALLEKIHSYQKQIVVIKETKYQLQKEIRVYQEKVNQDGPALSKLKELEEQLRRLYTTLKMKDQQIYTLQLKLKSRQNNEIEQLSKIRHLLNQKQSIIRSLKIDKQTTENRLAQYSHNISRIKKEQQQRFQALNRDLIAKVGTLEQILRGQRKRISDLERECREKQRYAEDKYQIELQKIVAETQHRYREDLKSYSQNQSFLQVRIKELEGEIERVREKCDWYARKERQSADVIVNLQKKYALQIQELTRSTLNVRENQEINEAEKKKLMQRIGTLEIQLGNRQREHGNLLRSRTRQLEDKIQNLYRENRDLLNISESLKLQLSQQVKNFDRERRNFEQHYGRISKEELHNKQTIIASLQRQLKSVKSDYEGIVNSTKSSEETIRNYKDRLVMLSGQVERLTKILTTKEDEMRKLNGDIQNYRSMSQQNQSLKARFEEQKGRIQKYYLGEISALTTKITMIEKQKEKYERQNREIKTQGIQSHAREIQQLRQQQARDRQEISRFEMRVKQLDGQIQSLQFQLQQKNKEIIIIKQQRQNTINQSRYQQLEVEVKNLRQIMKQLQDVNAHLIVERDQLFRVSHEYKQQIDEYKIRIKQQERVKDSMNMEQHRKQLDRISQQNQVRLRDQEAHYRNQLKQIQQMKNGEIQKIERSHSLMISERNEEYKKLKFQFDQLYQITHEQQQKIQELERNREGNISQERSITELRSINLQITQQYNQSIKQKQELQHRTGMLHREIEQLRISLQNYERSHTQVRGLKQQLEQSEEEIAKWKESSEVIQQQYEKLYFSYQESIEKHESLHLECQNQNKLVNQYQNKIRALQAEFGGLEQRLRKERAQKQHLKHQLAQIKTSQNLQDKNHHLSAEIDRLTILVDNYKKQISELRLNYSDRIALEKRLEEYMGLMVILFAQIQSLRKRVSETEQQCENVRRSSLTPHRIDRSSSDNQRRRY